MKKEDGNNSDNYSNDNSDCNSVLVSVIELLLAARWIWRLGTSVLAPRKEARSGSAHEIISLLFSFQYFILLGLRLQRIFTYSFELSCWVQQPQRFVFVCRHFCGRNFSRRQTSDDTLHLIFCLARNLLVKRSLTSFHCI